MPSDIPANPLDRPGYTLEFQDEFDGGDLDPEKWLPYYAPHWSSRERSRPRYRVAGGHLTLRIDPDQEPWCPEFDGAVKVSSIQTGLFAGPVGSSAAQYRFREGLVVREAQPVSRLYLPTHGYFELRAKADISANNLVALFMIGFEDKPEDSGEITVMEIFGRNILPEGTRLGHGIKRINDPRLSQEFFEDPLPFDVTDWHIYAAEWSPSGVDFLLDNRPLHRVGQSPAYPMQVMLNIYQLPDIAAPLRERPATFTIDYFRGYRRAAGQG
jgi:hypothetical protein